jgi:hypothetical protein
MIQRSTTKVSPTSGGKLMPNDHAPGTVIVLFKKGCSLKEMQQAIDDVNKQVNGVCLWLEYWSIFSALVKVPEGRELECIKWFEKNPNVVGAGLDVHTEPA